MQNSANSSTSQQNTNSTSSETPVAEQPPTSSETPVAEQPPTSSETPVAEQPSTSSETPVAEQPPTSSETPVAEQTSTSSETPVAAESILLDSVENFESVVNNQLSNATENQSILELSNSFQSIIDSNNSTNAPLLAKKKNSDSVDKIYHSIKDTYRGLNIDRNNIFMVVLKGIEIIESIKTLDGADKYELLKKTLNIIINELNIDEDEKRFILISTKSFIETAILSSKGKLIKKTKVKKRDKNVNKENRIATGQIIESLVEKLLTIVRKKNYTVNDFIANISTIVGMIIQLIDNYKYLTGIEKKEIVIQTIKVFINDKLSTMYTIDNKTLKMLNFVIDTLPHTIDLLISVNNNKHSINQITVSIVSKLKGCANCKNRKN